MKLKITFFSFFLHGNPRKEQISGLLLAALLFLNSVGCSIRSDCEAIPSSHTKCYPSAHRGDRTFAFDNSIRAIHSAAEHHIPFIEIDVRMDADGELFLFHDKHLSVENFIGAPDLIGRPSDSLSKSDRALIRLPTNDLIATFDEALEEILPYQSRLQLDLKPESDEEITGVLDAIVQKNAVEHVVVQCQELSCLTRIRRDYPKIRVLARVNRVSDLTSILALSPYIIQVDREVATLELARLAHHVRALLLVKTLEPESDTPAEWKSLCSIGVDILLTDKPIQFLEVMNTQP